LKAQYTCDRLARLFQEMVPTARQSGTDNFPLFAVLFVILGAILIISSIAVWCRVCRRQEGAAVE